MNDVTIIFPTAPPLLQHYPHLDDDRILIEDSTHEVIVLIGNTH